MTEQSLVNKAVALSAAALQVVADGLHLSPTDIVRERLTICEQCEHYMPAIYCCGVCGCYMPIKAYIRGVACPSDPPKWGPDISRDND